MRLRSKMEPQKIHPAMYKQVYIVPLQHFGRVCGVYNNGESFYVQHSSKMEVDTFTATDLVST